MTDTKGKMLRSWLIAFVSLSIGVAVYKIIAGPADTATEPAGISAAAALPPAVPEPATGAPVSRTDKTALARKIAVVYYFYTDTRCSSCRRLEAYTREAVAEKFAAGYKGWNVGFRGINVDEAANKSYIRVYRLDSKAVLVQKFEGEKPLQWVKLDKVWQLLGDKEAFINYVAAETQALLDKK